MLFQYSSRSFLPNPQASEAAIVVESSIGDYDSTKYDPNPMPRPGEDGAGKGTEHESQTLTKLEELAKMLCTENQRPTLNYMIDHVFFPLRLPKNGLQNTQSNEFSLLSFVQEVVAQFHSSNVSTKPNQHIPASKMLKVMASLQGTELGQTSMLEVLEKIQEGGKSVSVGFCPWTGNLLT